MKTIVTRTGLVIDHHSTKGMIEFYTFVGEHHSRVYTKTENQAETLIAKCNSPEEVEEVINHTKNPEVRLNATKNRIKSDCKANNGVALYQDKYNSIKMWRVTREKNRHYTLAQQINGGKWVNAPRIGLNHIAQVLESQLN